MRNMRVGVVLLALALMGCKDDEAEAQKIIDIAEMIWSDYQKKPSSEYKNYSEQFTYVSDMKKWFEFIEKTYPDTDIAIALRSEGKVGEVDKTAILAEVDRLECLMEGDTAKCELAEVLIEEAKGFLNRDNMSPLAYGIAANYISRAQSAAGDIEGATASWRDAAKNIKLVNEEPMRSELIAATAAAATASGDIKTSLDLLGQVELGLEGDTGEFVVDALALQDEVAEAISTAVNIPTSLGAYEALDAALNTRLIMKDFGGANAIAGAYSDISLRLAAFLGIAEAAHRAGEKDISDNAIIQALTTVGNLEPVNSIAGYIEIAKTERIIGNINAANDSLDMALLTARTVDDAYHNIWRISLVIEEKALLGKTEGLNDIMNEILPIVREINPLATSFKDLEIRVEFLTAVAKAQVAMGKKDEAKATLKLAEESITEINASGKVPEDEAMFKDVANAFYAEALYISGDTEGAFTFAEKSGRYEGLAYNMIAEAQRAQGDIIAASNTMSLIGENDESIYSVTAFVDTVIRNRDDFGDPIIVARGLNNPAQRIEYLSLISRMISADAVKQ